MRARDHAERERIIEQRRNIVDQRRARRECGFHHRRFACVDRNRRAARDQPLDHGQNAFLLIFFPDHRRAGARRFTTDIDDRRTLRRHFDTECGGCGGIVEQIAAARKTVRRHIENCHDLRLIEPDHAFAELERRTRRERARNHAARRFALIGRQARKEFIDPVDRHQRA